MHELIDLQPTLVGRLVIIRPIAAEDFDGLFAAAADPAIWEQHPAKDRYTETVFRQYFSGAMNCGSAFVFVDVATDSVIGSSRFYGYDAKTKEIEIGWTFLARQYWGGAYNREIKQLMIEHALQFVSSVVFWVGEDNVRSRRALEKIGAVLRDGVYTRSEMPGARHVVYEFSRP